MTLRLKNRKEIHKYLQQMVMRVEKALIYTLEAEVQKLQDHAKVSGAYQDRTSNLRSSIGGVVLKDRKPVTYAGFEGQGGQQGMDFINSLISQQSSGYVLLIVAGMEYASYVEDLHNLNVLNRTELKMRRELPVKLERLKQSIQR